MPCEILYGFLLLMPFSFGDRLTLSVRCFLLSLITEMDPPWPSLLSPCHVWKVPLTTMDIVSLVEYWQGKLIWLSVVQKHLMYLHSLSLCTRTLWGVFLVIALPQLSWVCTELSQSPDTCKPQQTTCLRGRQHWEPAHLCGKTWHWKIEVYLFPTLHRAGNVASPDKSFLGKDLNALNEQLLLVAHKNMTSGKLFQGRRSTLSLCYIGFVPVSELSDVYHVCSSPSCLSQQCFQNISWGLTELPASLTPLTSPSIFILPFCF